MRIHEDLTVIIFDLPVLATVGLKKGKKSKLHIALTENSPLPPSVPLKITT